MRMFFPVFHPDSTSGCSFKAHQLGLNHIRTRAHVPEVVRSNLVCVFRSDLHGRFACQCDFSTHDTGTRVIG